MRGLAKEKLISYGRTLLLQIKFKLYKNVNRETCVDGDFDGNFMLKKKSTKYTNKKNNKQGRKSAAIRIINIATENKLINNK